MNHQKIKDRIKKLLSMANDSGSPHEASIAARRVQKLMAEYNLEMVDIIAQDILDDDNVIKAGNTYRYKRTPTYIEWIEYSIAKAFNCEVKGEWKIEEGVEYDVSFFYGYETDVEIATWLCSYIIDQLERLAKRVAIPPFYRENRLSRRYMADWRKGAAKEICNRISDFYGDNDQADQSPITSTGKTLVSLKNEAIVRRFGEFSYHTSKTYRYTDDGMTAGKMAAESIDISKNLADDPRALLPAHSVK